MTNERSAATEWLENDTIQSLLKEHLDETDYRIYKALNEDGRMSDTELGERVGLSRTAAHRRRKKLEEEGIIDVLGVLVLQEADFAYADVFVKLSSEATVDELDEFLETVKGDEFIYEIEEYMGTYDLLLRVWHATLGDIQSYLRTQLQCHDLVAKYEAMPVTKTHKAWHKPITN
ncbi:Lrp/AsnC family transcriptional regulator [Haloferax volcanii]|uniref:Transcriptional regulator, AsnC family protein n=3 Tax=Haloferax volcanii TaxID=2246 RepID=A0A384L857_HALVD|nr:Lrp/AsnC family transcriptional regulator [Haloferax volcanii]ADE02049.1 Lrp/AsnC family transcription regulator [Haloferax volcanii DS2]ELY30784.1 transcriptional regulator, AsnC family protein [Haloferax volcanii DS2]MBS8121004.1 Lrp/AsnC family transcriptional regulator [Haloferax volcanii]MBS8126041.1 Lrp/AsnC family transcriptional regulator [Haloferax volcanii]MBS8129894.1 Lrp/AsnC family transcriptional regulator [Haloferax volcanii]